MLLKLSYSGCNLTSLIVRKQNVTWKIIDKLSPVSYLNGLIELQTGTTEPSLNYY